ncbi:hypothetical protein AA0113_g8739 [Alternaria arborescens]|uniref:Aerolysin-like C-terminal domain-containing protein n=1 Tax=Alternaria arborescens TaxID=156630 RepID=A0A4Q4RFX1_9PLEO|nr:hypothetical protein AA0113_g8739 [Alternaria arborescens]
MSSKFYIPPPSIRTRLVGIFSRQVLFSRPGSVGNYHMSQPYDDQYWYIRPVGSSHPNRYLVVSGYTDAALFASSSGSVGCYAPIGKYEDQYFELQQGQGVRSDQFRLHVPATNSVIYSRTDQDPTVGCYHADGEPYPDHWFKFELEPLDLVRTDYDVKNARILSTQPKTIFSQKSKNDSDREQTPTISISETTGQSSTFETEVGLELGVTTSFSAGLPIVAEGKVEISAKMHTNLTIGTTNTSSQSWEATVSMNVPAHSVYRVTATVIESVLEVPFTSTWKSKTSGVTMTTEGTFKGNSCGDLSTHYFIDNK